MGDVRRATEGFANSESPKRVSHFPFHKRFVRMANKKRVAMIGLGFGAEFIPIYQRHPNAEVVAVCRRNAKSTPGARNLINSVN